MDIGYQVKYFINPFIEHGIECFNADKNGEAFPRVYTYEMNVIKTLTIIYGEKSILLPYKIDNEKAFICNLLIYDMKEYDIKRFIKLLNDYHTFILNFRSIQKANGLMNEIEKILIQMIEKRNSKKEFTEEEFKEFDSIFNPTAGDLKGLKKLVSNDQGLIPRTWELSKNELTNTQMRLMAVNPNLLMPDQYAKFGFNIKDVACMSSVEIDNINQIIENEENVNNNKVIIKKNKRQKLVLSCGNGFVDKLLLFSIVATELMVGIIVASRLIG